MSGLLIAVLAAAAPPTEGPPVLSPTPPAASAESPQHAPRSGNELRDAARDALRRWARPSDEEADAAARELITLLNELRQDDRLAASQRAYYLAKVRYRLERLSDQIAKRVARQKRLAATRRPETLRMPDGEGGVLAQQQAAGSAAGGFGRRTGPAGDYGQELVELIQRTIRPESWDVNGGPGTIYYWRPGRAMVVRQTWEVHEELDDLLRQLRRLGW